VIGRRCGLGLTCVLGCVQRLPNGDQRAEALRFLVHFVGDVHQPLHVGFLSNLGGNTLRGSFFGAVDNLHHIWDFGILQQRLLDFSSLDEVCVVLCCVVLCCVVLCCVVLCCVVLCCVVLCCVVLCCVVLC
jgi:hypothetical protein